MEKFIILIEVLKMIFENGVNNVFKKLTFIGGETMSANEKSLAVE